MVLLENKIDNFHLLYSKEFQLFQNTSTSIGVTPIFKMSFNHGKHGIGIDM